MNKATRLYIVDAILAISFILAGITGVAKMPGWFNLPLSWILPLRYIHDWSGILMVVLVGVHLLQHWKWIVLMTKKLIVNNEPVRNTFIILGAIVLTLIISLVVLSITNNDSSSSQQSIDSDVTSSDHIHTDEPQYKNVKTGGCPFGVENDTFPGDCALYKDNNHNGLCDYGE